MDVRNVVERAVWTVVQSAAASALVFLAGVPAEVEGASVAVVAAVAVIAGAVSAVKTIAQEKLKKG